MTEEIILAETEIFDKATKYIEVPSSAITISLSDDDKVCFLIDVGEEDLPCGLLEGAYLQLLKVIKTTPQEAVKKFEDIREEYTVLGSKRAIFIGWINTQFKNNAPKQLMLVIRQRTISGIIRRRPKRLTEITKEILKYCLIEDYYIGTYEQIFLLKHNNINWAFIYSDVNQYPPTLFEGVSFEEGEIKNFKKAYTHEKFTGLFEFFRDTFEPKKKIKIRR